MKGSGFKVFHRFTFRGDKSVYVLVIYFIIQSFLEIRSKTLHRFPSKRERRQSAVLFILSTAAAILTQTNRMKSPPCQYILL